MRTVRNIAIITCSLLLFGAGTAYAVSIQAYQDYQYQFGLYRQKLTEYTTAITEYKKFNSLTTQQAALDAAKAVITQRDLAAKTYYLFLNEKLNENPGITTSEATVYRAAITDTIAFLDANAADAGISQSLSEADTVSRAFTKQYMAMQANYRQTAIAIQLGYLTYFAAKFDAGAAQATALIAAAKPQLTPEKQGTLDRWLVTLTNQHSLYVQKATAIAVIQKKITGDLTEQERQLSSAQKAINEAKQILTEGASYLKEVEDALRYD